jgi:hypothetical protein
LSSQKSDAQQLHPVKGFAESWVAASGPEARPMVLLPAAPWRLGELYGTPSRPCKSGWSYGGARCITAGQRAARVTRAAVPARRTAWGSRQGAAPRRARWPGR